MSGAKPVFTLYVSVATIYRVRLFIETDLPLFKSYWNADRL